MRPLKLLCCTFLLAVAPFILLAQKTTNQPGVRWLEGVWKAPNQEEKAPFYEAWTCEGPYNCQGQGFWVKDGDTIMLERLFIQPFGDHLTYVSVMGTQYPTLFTLISTDLKVLRFSNPEHDAPQEIIYTLQPDGSLETMVISGENKIKTTLHRLQE